MKPLAVVGLLLVGALAYRGVQAILRSPALRVAEFVVEGNSEDRVTTEEIVRASGVEMGEHLLGVSTSGVAGLVAEVPWVAEARVERILPSKLKISIREREPSLVVLAGDRAWLIDDQGLVLQEGDGPYVSVAGLPVADVQRGLRIAAVELAHAAQILSGLPRQIRESVVAIRAPTVDRIEFETSDGLLVHYGAAEQTGEKNDALRALIAELPPGELKARVLDVRVPSRPATRLRQP